MSEIEFNNPCSNYTTDDWDQDLIPCKCPICGGFLPRDIFQDPLICKKCGSELVAIEHGEKFKESDDYDFSEGKICVVTKRTKTKQQTREERQINRLIKEGHDKWKGFI